jgi:hypothetical protein
VQQSKASTSYDTEIDEVMRHMVPILMTFAGDDPIG